MRLFEAGDAADHRFLHIEGQRGADAVAINLVGVEAFGLEENLVAGLIGEAHHFVFDGGAVARADANSIWPLYIGARWRFARMRSWMAAFVAESEQWTWGSGGFQHLTSPPLVLRGRIEEGVSLQIGAHKGPPPAPRSTREGTDAGQPAYSFKNENGIGSASPGCCSKTVKSMERGSSGGAPVLSRPSSRPRRQGSRTGRWRRTRRLGHRGFAIRRCACSARRNVPVVTTTARQFRRVPFLASRQRCGAGSPR